MDAANLTEATREALAMLRDASSVHWSVVTFFGLAVYVYSVEIERRRWDIVAAGAAFFLMDVFNELVNSAVLHVTERSALWTITGDTSYLVLVGWNIEIIFLFLISGIVFVKQLPQDRTLMVAGIPNRWLFITAWSCIAVFVEVLLVHAGIFHWEYWFWNEPFLLPIVVFGYGTFFAIAAYVYDRQTDAQRWRIVTGMAAVDLLLAVAFGLAGWL